jgi:hypothetical protein
MIKQRRNILKGESVLLKSYKYPLMPFAAVAHLDEGLSLETLLILNEEKCLIRLMDIQRTSVFIREQKLILVFKTVTRNKALRYCRLECDVF